MGQQQYYKSVESFPNGCLTNHIHVSVALWFKQHLHWVKCAIVPRCCIKVLAWVLKCSSTIYVGSIHSTFSCTGSVHDNQQFLDCQMIGSTGLWSQYHIPLDARLTKRNKGHEDQLWSTAHKHWEQHDAGGWAEYVAMHQLPAKVLLRVLLYTQSSNSYSN